MNPIAPGTRQIAIRMTIRRSPRLRQQTIFAVEGGPMLSRPRVVDLARLRCGIASGDLAGKTGHEWLDDLRDPADQPQIKPRT